MENSNILVTGGAGFVGSNLIKSLKKKYPEAKIVSVDNYFTGKRENHIEGVEYIDQSVAEFLKSDSDFVPNYVFHFGEYSRIVKSFEDIEYLMETNLTSTSTLLERCRQWNAKLIYSASSSKFGNGGEDENLSPYAWVKAKMVELIKNYRRWYGLSYEIVYFFNVYGEGQIEEGDYATVIGIFEKQYREGKALTVVHPGTQSRDFTHIDDIVEGTLLAATKNLNHEWHLRTGINTKIIDLALMFDSPYKLVPARRGERFDAQYFESDTESLLGWKPKMKLIDYIKTITNPVTVEENE